MTRLITWFMGGAGRLQGLLIAALVVAVLCLGLFGWGMVERSGKLSAQVALEKRTGELAVCNERIARMGDRVEIQNTGVQGAADESKAAIEKGKRERDRLATELAIRNDEIRRLEALLAAPRGNTCAEAWRDIAGGAR